MRHFAITILMLAAALVLSGRAACAQGSYSGTQPRARVIIDNDFGGDPDGRMIRVYTRLDSHLIFEDMLAKFSNWYDREDTD